MHFFNPAPVMKLVEVVHTVLTDADVVAAVRSLASTCGKTPVVVGDRAGFVANALLFGYLNDAARAAETGQAARRGHRRRDRCACGLPMGPLTLMDLIGLDVSLDVLETMFAETRDQRYAPAPLLRRMVTAGRLGRKSGRGYYDYSGASRRSAARRSGRSRWSAGPASGWSPLSRCEVAGRRGVSAALAVVPVEDVAGCRRRRRRRRVVERHRGAAGAGRRLAEAAAVIAVATTDEAPLGTLAVGTGPRRRGRRAVPAVGAERWRRGGRRTLRHRPGGRTSRGHAAGGLIGVPAATGRVTSSTTLVLPHLGDAVRMVDDHTRRG